MYVHMQHPAKKKNSILLDLISSIVLSVVIEEGLPLFTFWSCQYQIEVSCSYNYIHVDIHARKHAYSFFSNGMRREIN